MALRYENSYALMQALIARKVIGDFREPDTMRFGITPLFINESDILEAVSRMEDILATDAWKSPEYQVKAAVT